MDSTIKYIHDASVHNFHSPEAMVPLVMQLIRPSTVLDVGCGVGNWLKVFESNGVGDYLGIDGGNVDRRMLKIHPDRFLEHDLRTPLQLNRRYDLALALEVAEHLPESSAEVLVRTLVDHADTILFSAAIPGQGGQHHVNEQWPEYWIGKFGTYGYNFHDVIRPRIWNDERIQFWYRQNTFVVSRRLPESAQLPLAIVHPELLRLKLAESTEYKESLLNGRQGVGVSTKILFNALLFKLRRIFGLS